MGAPSRAEMIKATKIKACDVLPNAPQDLSALLVHRYPGRQVVARIAAVGDTCFGGRVAQTLGAEVPLGPREVSAFLAGADLVFTNLEGTFLDQPVSDLHFAGPLEGADALVAVGIGVANLANNHTIEQGRVGLMSTVQALQQRGVKILGAGRTLTEAADLVRSDVGDLRIGWLAAGRTGHKPVETGWWINELDRDAIVRQTRESREQVDCLIVSLHTGFMFVEYPDPETRDLAHRLAEAGASLILMHHPHVLQGVEVLQNGSVVCYSLGNFLFDWRAGNIPNVADEQLQREGAIFCFELDHQGVIAATLVPTVVDDDCDVRWPEPDQAAEILGRVERLSQALVGGDWEPEFWRQRAERNTLHGIKTLWYVLRKGRLAELYRLSVRLRPQHLAMFWSWLVQKTKDRV